MQNRNGNQGSNGFWGGAPSGTGMNGAQQGGSQQSGGSQYGAQQHGAQQQGSCSGCFTGSSRWNTEAASGPIDTKDLSIIQDEMHSEALLYKKCTVYADYFTDPQLKNVARTAAEHHRRHFDSLNGYLNSSK